MLNNVYPPDEIRTKIAGVTMGASRNGVPLRQSYLNALEKKKITQVRLVREPENEYDSKAIAIHADYGSGDVHLGYIQNKARICLSCSKEFQMTEGDTIQCSNCGGILARKGLATTLSDWIDQGINFKAEILQITGGNGKTRGCNIKVTRAI